MTTAKERYYAGCLGNAICSARDYVTELEQELIKLKESQTQKSIIKLCNRVDKAEAEKAELQKEVEKLGLLIMYSGE